MAGDQQEKVCLIVVCLIVTGVPDWEPDYDTALLRWTLVEGAAASL